MSSWLLSDPAHPSQTLSIVPSDGDVVFKYDQDISEQWPFGATVATVTKGPRRLTRITLPDLLCFGLGSKEAVLAFLNRPVLLIRTDQGDITQVTVITPPTVTEPNAQRNTFGQVFMVSAEFVPV